MDAAASAAWGLLDEAAALYDAGRRAYEQGLVATEPDVATVAWNLAIERLERANDLYRKLIDEAPDDVEIADGLASSLLYCGLAAGRLGHVGAAIECLHEAAELVAAQRPMRPSAPRSVRSLTRWWRSRRLG